MLVEPVPLTIRNAPTGLMKDLHYGDGYVYAHDTKEKIARDAVPAGLPGGKRILPSYGPGAEEPVKGRLEEIKKWKRGQ